MKEYILKPIMTRPTVTLTPNPDKPAVAKLIPPRQPLPTAVIDPAKGILILARYRRCAGVQLAWPP
jgi:hypothetical protein